MSINVTQIFRNTPGRSIFVMIIIISFSSRIQHRDALTLLRRTIDTETTTSKICFLKSKLFLMLSWNLHSLTNSCELGAVRDACPRPDSLKIYMLYLNVYTGKFSKIIAYNQNFTKKYALLTLKQKLDKCKFRSVYEL